MRRRSFARALGAAALFAPFLAQLGRTRAQPRLGRAKYLCLITTTGSNPGLWDGSTLFNASNDPLRRVADDVVVVSRLNGNGQCASHGSPGGLTGVGYSGSNHTSIDQYVASALMTGGVRTAIPSLILGGDPTQESSTFWRGGERLSPIARPVAAFDAIFAGAMPGGGAPSTEAPSDLLRRRRSILDLMLSELDQLRGQLGAEERRKLELHAESIRALEMRLSGEGGSGGDPAPGSCAPPAGVENGDQVLVDDARCLDLAITALGCDLTRVVAVELGHHQGTQVRLPGMSGGDWHSNYLHSNQVADLTALEAWLTEQFVLAMEKAKRIPAPDGDGTLYDQTLFVWARTMGDAVAHVDSDMRTVFAGGAGGYLRRAAGGRHVDARGQSHQRALLNCAAALGVADLSSFGSGSVGPDGRLPLEEVAS